MPLVFALCFGVLGYSFSFSNPGLDSFGISIAFEEYAASHTSFFGVIREYLSGEIPDIYSYTMYVLFRNANARWLFLGFGVIYGLLFAKMQQESERYSSEDMAMRLLFLLLLFAAAQPVLALNNLRSGTAGVLFLVFVLNYIKNPKLKTLFFALSLPCLIHFSFIAYSACIFLMFVIIKKAGKENLCPWFILVSLLMFAFADIFSLELTHFSGSIGRKLASYTSSESIDSINQGLAEQSLLAKIFLRPYQYILGITLAFVGFSLKKASAPTEIIRLFLILSACFTLWNLGSLATPLLQERIGYFAAPLFIGAFFRFRPYLKTNVFYFFLALICLVSLGRLYQDCRVASIIVDSRYWNRGTLFDVVKLPTD